LPVLKPKEVAMVVLAGCALLAGCHGARPASLGVRQGRLAACPWRPNCVSSLDPGDRHRISPIPFAGTGRAAIEKLAGIVRSLPRASVITSTENYLHAEFRSALFRFADEPAGVIQVRSASRVGFSDLGVNRRRIEAIRARWSAAAPNRE